MSDADPQRDASRLGELETRLAALEGEVAKLRELAARGGPAAEPVTRSAPQTGEVAPPAPVVVAMPAGPVVGPASSAPLSPASPSGLTDRLRAIRPLAAASAFASGGPAARAVPKPVQRERKPKQKGAGLSGLEQALGGRWYALIGAVILIIGIGLFFKLAVEQGWLHVSPLARCVGVALAGFALLGGGEWAIRKLTRAASAGLSAAGIGTLLASVWAAHRMYDLTGSALAFVLMAAACALGVVIAARSGLASVALAALLGAYLNPAVVGDAHQSKVAYFAYMLMVLGTGLALLLWKGRAFAPVRSLAWWGTILFGGVVAASEAVRADAVPPLAFVILAWFMVQGELAISAGRFGLVGPPPAGPAGGIRELFTGEFSGKALAGGLRVWRPVTSSFSTTAWSAVLATVALDHLMSVPSWLAPAFLAAVALGGAHVLSGHLRFLTDAPENDAERVGTSLAVQSGGLLIAAVSMAMSGGTQAVAWLALGVAAIAGGRWIRARALDVYGLIVMSVGTLRLVLYDAHFGPSGRVLSEALGLAWSVWTLLALTCACSWGAAAWFTRRDPTSRWIVVSNLSVGIGLSVAGLAPTELAHISAASAVVAGLVGIAAVYAAGRLVSWGLGLYGLGVLGLSLMIPIVGGAWTIHEAKTVRWLGLLLSEWSAALVLVAAGWGACRWLAPRSLGGRWVLHLCSAGMVLSLMCAVGHSQASAGSLSIAWCIVALAGIAAGCRTAWKDLQLPAVGAMLLAVLAWLAAFSPLCGRWEAGSAPALMSAGLLTAIAVIGGCAVSAWLLRAEAARDREGRAARLKGLWAVPAIVGVVVLWIASSMEAGRIGEIVSSDRTVQRAAVSVWWGIFGLGLITAGFVWPTADKRGVPAARRAGLALVAVGVLKMLIWDLISVPQGARVISFIGLGLLMMAVTVVYAKLTGRLKPPAIEAGDARSGGAESSAAAEDDPGSTGPAPIS